MTKELIEEFEKEAQEKLKNKEYKVMFTLEEIKNIIKNKQNG